MLKPLLSSFIIFAISSSLSSAAPAVYSTSDIRRAAESSESGKSGISRRAFNGPVTVTTTTTTQTNVGTVTQTCEITLTPIQVNGQDAVREDKKCKETVSSNGNTNSNTGNNGSNNSNNNGSSSSSPGTTTTTSSSSTTTSGTDGSNNNNNGGAQSSGFVSPSDVSVIGTGTGTATTAATTSVSNTGSNNGSNAPPNVVVIGMTTVTGTQTGSSSIPAATGGNTNGVVSPGNVSVVGQSSVQATGASPAADQSSASAAAAQASTTGFTIPGKTLQVLPIGLGVFAGISVIALIVVGLVTYERTKYRKTFRQRKLAEAAAPMGYGGMAERS